MFDEDFDGTATPSQVKFNDDDHSKKRFMRRRTSEDDDDDYYNVEGEEEGEFAKSDSVQGPIEITTAILKQIHQELCLVRLSWPDISCYDDTNEKYLPSSYSSNSDKEKLLLWYAENFRKQYHAIYKDRKPLLFARDNECGIQVGVQNNIFINTE